MIRTVVGFLGLLLLLPALQARDKPEKKTPAQQYQALSQEFDKAMQEFQKAYQEAKTPQDKQKVFQDKYPQPEKYAPRFLEVAEKDPKDPAALDALTWILNHVRAAKSDPNSPQTVAMKILLRDHVQSDKIASLCQTLGYSQDEDSRKFLQAVLEKNKHRTAQAQACMALAQQAENRLRLARQFKEQPNRAKMYENVMGKEAVEALVKAGPEKLK